MSFALYLYMHVRVVVSIFVMVSLTLIKPGFPSNSHAYSSVEEVTNPVTGLFDLDKLEVHLQKTWGPFSIPCFEQLKRFVQIWNERYSKTRDVFYTFELRQSWDKALKEFSACAKDFNILKEESMEALDGTEFGSLGNSSSIDGGADMGPTPERKDFPEKTKEGGSSPSSGGSSHGSPYTKPPGSSSPVGPAAGRLLSSNGGLAARGESGGPPRGRGRESSSFNFGIKNRKSSPLEILKVNYETVNEFERLEREALEAQMNTYAGLSQDGKRRKELEEELKVQRKDAKDALLSIFRNKGLTRRERINAYDKYARIEDEEHGGVPAPVFGEAVELIKNLEDDYAKGLEELGKQRKTGEDSKPCNAFEAQKMFKDFGEVVEERIEGMGEIVGKIEDTERTESLQKPKDQEEVFELLHRESRDSNPDAQTREVLKKGGHLKTQMQKDMEDRSAALAQEELVQKISNNNNDERKAKKSD